MIVDAMGLSCPLPIVMAKKAVATGEKEIEIIVDNATSKANVIRFMTNSGFELKEENENRGELHMNFVK